MMTLEELEARHLEELADYHRERKKRFDSLEQQQKDLLGGLTWTDTRAHSILQKLLQEQRQGWEAVEKDELDLLSHLHSLERESFFEKQTKRNEMAEKIVTSRNKINDRDL